METVLKTVDRVHPRFVGSNPTPSATEVLLVQQACVNVTALLIHSRRAALPHDPSRRGRSVQLRMDLHLAVLAARVRCQLVVQHTRTPELPVDRKPEAAHIGVTVAARTCHAPPPLTHSRVGRSRAVCGEVVRSGQDPAVGADRDERGCSRVSRASASPSC